MVQGLFQAGSPQPLFEVKTSGDTSREQFQASGDGTRFLVNAQVENVTPRSLTVVQNWKVEGR